MTAYRPSPELSGHERAPGVSFLVTSYNKAAYLPAVLESVAEEAASTDGEIILVDDGSTDGSDRICQAFANSHPRVHYWRQDNLGIYPTMNLIAAKARAEWVRFCDSDDPLIPGSTGCLLKAAKETRAGVVYGGAIPYGPEPLAESRGRPRVPLGEIPVHIHPDGLMYLIRGMNFTPSMALYRRKAFEGALPLPTDLISCQDLALLFPVVKNAPLAQIETPVCFNLKGAPNQLSANHALTLQQTISITRRNADLLSPAHKRAALLKAANRTRRWLRCSQPERNSIRMQIRLIGVALKAKLGLADFASTLDAIANTYEPALRPLLERRAKPF